MKRGRVDVGVARDVYERNEIEHLQEAEEKDVQSHRASEDVVRSRKIYANVTTRVCAVSSRQHHLAVLNSAFVRNLQSQLTHNKNGDWSENMREYVMYAREIESKLGARTGQVMTFGSGDCGQLGHGVDDDEDLMVKFPRVVATLERKSVIRMTCGGLHSAVVTCNGEVYTWGCNDDGALGRSGEENVPARVEGFGPQSDARALLVVGGDSHTAVVTTDGQVWTWGAYKDKEGKLWCDSSSAPSSFKQKQTRPFRIKQLQDIVDFRCGSAFNVARAANGHVFSWGLGEMGQLGRKVNPEMKDAVSDEYNVTMVFREHLTPGRVTLGTEELPPVKSIGCGSYHTLVSLSENGALYTTGLNNYGQLGIGHTENCDTLQLVEDLANSNIAQAEGGTHHSVVLTTDGHVYCFGRADSGQLGVLDQCKTGDFKDRPHRVALKDTVTYISSGSNHVLALTEENEIYSWGYGDMLALGNGMEQDENRPYRLNWSKTKFGEADILQIDAGGQHSAILAVAKECKHG